jgi:hypothetical protein
MVEDDVFCGRRHWDLAVALLSNEMTNTRERWHYTRSQFVVIERATTVLSRSMRNETMNEAYMVDVRLRQS